MKSIDQIIEELGIGTLSEELQETTLANFMEILQTNVGNALADKLTDAQLEEFVTISEQKDEDAAFEWLTKNYPGFQTVVDEETDKLIAETNATADGIVDQI